MKRKKSKKAPKCLNRLKIEKIQVPKEIAHTDITHKWARASKKWQRRESNKNGKYFCRSELYNDHLYHFCGAVVVVKTVIIGQVNNNKIIDMILYIFCLHNHLECSIIIRVLHNHLQCSICRHAKSVSELEWGYQLPWKN